ncbi:class A beta-lactamase [Cryptosporangium aurantiacum]|uniref:Beta-lactamase class A n=1 Tax=Cryptosporangium aurantiacum TaxID=134849 RepID=A0A1M7TYS9_9ACTN|nr:class A beta-lactamase [Cryptosporangium aurantiacum]SHN75922.1 beta-lactamase class A [Cryptosporangium aurantiacum]
MPAYLTRRTVLLGGATLPWAAACQSGSPEPAPTRSTSSSNPAPSKSTPSQSTPSPDLTALETSLGTLIGAWALDTGNGVTVSHRADERFGLNSTFKVLAAAAVAQRGGLDRVVRWTRADLVAHSPITEQHVDDGLPLEQVCAASVTHSDNAAGNLLLKELGGPGGVTRFVRTLGDDATRLDRWEPALNAFTPGDPQDTTTPAAIGRTLQRLVLGDGLDGTARALVTSWLRANTTGNLRIRAGLPSDWTVGDKTGTGDQYGAANDIAVAWPPSGAPIVYAIYTRRPTEDEERDESVVARTATILTRALGRL